MTWEDLSDDELRARFEQRQLEGDPLTVEFMIANREEPTVAAIISGILGEAE